MKTILAFCLLLSYVVSVYCYSYIDDTDDDAENDVLPSEYQAVQRRSRNFRMMCMKWQMPCLRNTKYRMARCCSDYTCKCNIWGANCRCD